MPLNSSPQPPPSYYPHYSATESDRSENDPLQPHGRKQQNTQADIRLIVYRLLGLFVAFILFRHFNNCPLYPSTMDQIRMGWEKEKYDHWVRIQQWNQEEQNHTQVHRQWELEAQAHLRQQERLRQKWQEEIKDQENQRKRWKWEEENHNRLEEERRGREEEERLKHNMYWDRVETHQCTTYATREYSAQLMNLPFNWTHRVEACKATPLVVHGVSHFPSTCEDKGRGVVIGRWEIDQNEPACATYWRAYSDKGCTSERSGKRRIEHYLEYLPQGGDWREFCATTPANFNGMHFAGPHGCYQRDLGTYGHWEIDDSSC